MKLTALIIAAALAAVQSPTLSQNVKQYVRTSAPVIVLTNARVIDGTAGPARDKQTIVIRDGLIAQLGTSDSITAPAGAEVVDLAGKTVIPGLVMLHEHLYYP